MEHENGDRHIGRDLISTKIGELWVNNFTTLGTPLLIVYRLYTRIGIYSQVGALIHAVLIIIYV